MSISLKPLDEQVIVILGASSGIGLATARMAVAKGASVVLAARSGQALNIIVEGLLRAGGNAMAATCDVSEREEVAAVAEAATARFGRIDTWVNNAGVSIYGRIDETADTDARRLFDVNFWGVCNGSLVALPYLLRQGGALINVGSEVSEAVIPLQGFYSASKHAVKGFTDALRLEVEQVSGAPVSITLIQPTAVDTPYPQHARNYMDCEPKLPDPMIDPDQVAEAILDAAVAPTRAKKVGFQAKLNTTMAKLLPSVADRVAAKYVEKQHYAEPPRHPQGALFQPSEATDVVGRTHGTGGREPA